MGELKTPLSAELERELLETVKAGQLAQRALDRERPPLPRERLLRTIIKNGADAVSQLVEHNLRMVTQEVTTHFRQDDPRFEDAMQNATVALLRAIERFDLTKAERLSTVAVTWLRGSASRSKSTLNLSTNLGREATVAERRITAYVYERLNAEGRSYGAVPSAEDTARHTGLEQGVVDALLPRIARTNSKFIDDEYDYEQPNIHDIQVEKAEHAAMRSTVESLIAELPDRERRVLRMRGGLGIDSVEYTQMQCARRLNLSLDKVRYAEKQGLRMLKDAALRAGLQLLLE